VKKSDLIFFEDKIKKLIQETIDCSHLKLVKTSSDKGDELDHASADRLKTLEFKLKTRESHYLKKLLDSQARIEQNTFGYCQECDQSISISRLKARPTATLCISCKELQEKEEKHIPYKKKSHSHGKELISDNVISVSFCSDDVHFDQSEKVRHVFTDDFQTQNLSKA